MIYRVDVAKRSCPGETDARGEGIARQAEALGIAGIEAITVSDLYFLQGDLDDGAVMRLIDELLHDPVVETATWRKAEHHRGTEDTENEERKVEQSLRLERSDALGCGELGLQTVEVTLLPGVTDSAAESLLAGARMANIAGLTDAATGHRYEIRGAVTESQLHRLASGLLANEVIQSYVVNAFVPPPLAPAQPLDSTVEVIPVAGLDDAGLALLSQERRLSLDLAEMQAIQAYFSSERREPTDVELEMLAQTWSEHCVHKTFRALIDYEEQAPDGRPISGTRCTIDSLLKTYIRAATETVAKPWVRSAFVDNAGIIAFDDRFDIAFKVETHNHPSALEPFGGANTGVGGVIRDVIGVSARPIANTDVLCFGPPNTDPTELPAGVLHPRRISDGVTAGIEDYGNKMGIPTVNGAILYDPGYTANPLVFCGCAGILPRGSHRTEPQPGDLVVVIGGRTGRDGLRGATFSSMEMDHQTGHVAGSAVQIGHPIHEKQALEAVLAARDRGLYTAITDCGAGGLSSAVGEMAKDLGCEVHLDRAPLKYPGLRPWEIWLSEAQERMVLAIPPEHWPEFRAICDGLDVEATSLGHFTGDGVLTICHESRIAGQLDAGFLHHGIPRRHLQAVWTQPVEAFTTSHRVSSLVTQRTQRCRENSASSVPLWGSFADHATQVLLELLAAPETRSKEDVVRQYDHEVQGSTVVKPFVGPKGRGPSDAAVLRPLDAARGAAPDAPAAGIALSAGINPAYGVLDPYAMAWAAVDEAIRNCVAAGADPDRVALLDNFCWGNPLLPDRLGGLVRCARGCYDAAVAYGAPFVSGKDSLNNEYTGPDGRKHAIPGTLLISALGIVPDVRQTVTSDLKRPGSRLYVLGLTRGELGGSAYARLARLSDVSGGEPPQPTPAAPALYRALHRAMRDGLVLACHDCSEGGLAVAAAEMALGGGLGVELDLADVPFPEDVTTDEAIAFCESLGRFIVEVAAQDAAAFETHFAGLPYEMAGRVRADDSIRLIGLNGRPYIEATLAEVERAWRGHLA